MTSTTKNVLLGCLTAMAAALVLGVASCVGFFVWLNRPGELLQPHRLIGSETTGYVELTLRLEDPGCRKVVEQLLEASEKTADAVRSPLPGGFRTWIQSIERQSNQRKMRQLFPMVAAWTVRPADQPGKDLHLLTLSIEHLGNRIVLADWILDHVLSWNEEIKSIHHGDETIHQIPISKSGHFLTFFIRGCDLFFVSDAETAERAVDRLARAEPQSPAGSALEALLASTPKSSPLRGAITNDHGELLRAWSRISGEGERHESRPDDLPSTAAATQAWATARSATLWGAFDEQGTLDLTVELRGADSQWATTNAPIVERGVRTLIEDMSLDTGDADMSSVTDSERIRVHAKIPQLPAKLSKILESHMRALQKRRERD